MPFSDFKICLSVYRIELIIKYRKIVIQKLYLTSKQKKWQKLGKNLQKLIVRFPEMCPRQFAEVCISFLNNDFLGRWLDLQNSCLLDVLKTAS